MIESVGGTFMLNYVSTIILVSYWLGFICACHLKTQCTDSYLEDPKTIVFLDLIKAFETDF